MCMHYLCRLSEPCNDSFMDVSRYIAYTLSISYRDFVDLQHNSKIDIESEVTIALLYYLALLLESGYVLAFHFHARHD